MENTNTIFGLSLIVFVLQFTDRSFVHGYYFKFSQGPSMLANGMSTQERFKMDPNIPIRSLQNFNTKNSQIGLDLQKQRFNFIENLKMFTEPLDNLKRAAALVFNGYADKETKNYVKLMGALDIFANNTVCNKSKLNDELIYTAIVSYAVAEANLVPHRVAGRILGIIEEHESKIQELKRTILEIISKTNCRYSTTDTCNKYIYRAVIRSGILLAEATILAKYADLAQNYVRNYHDEFIRVSNTNQVYPFLLKSLRYLTPLVRNIIETRWLAGINVCCENKNK